MEVGVLTINSQNPIKYTSPNAGASTKPAPTVIQMGLRLLFIRPYVAAEPSTIYVPGPGK
jgi:hypothetical protein